MVHVFPCLYLVGIIERVGKKVHEFDDNWWGRMGCLSPFGMMTTGPGAGRGCVSSLPHPRRLKIFVHRATPVCRLGLVGLDRFFLIRWEKGFDDGKEEPKATDTDLHEGEGPGYGVEHEDEDGDGF